jgi:NAD(P)-dependent dehydrogenase (short-subunit alcohol dehydrogenase family)
VEPAAIVLVRAAYTASKMAIEGFTGSLAHELGGFNLRVNWLSRATARPRASRATQVPHGRAESVAKRTGWN